MNTRRVKVWQTEDAILAAIDRAHRKAESLVVEETELRKESAELFGELEKTRFELMHSDLTKGKRIQLETRERVTEIEAAKKKAEAEAKAKAHTRIIEKTLPRLGEILAAMRTQTMPDVLGSYRGVALK
jgi:hypothetical protein